MQEEIQKALTQVVYLLGQQPELAQELQRLCGLLPPLLKAQSAELADLTGKLKEAQAKLAELEGQISAASLRHDQLVASENSMKGRLSDIRDRVNKAVAEFRLPRAEEREHAT